MGERVDSRWPHAYSTGGNYRKATWDQTQEIAPRRELDRQSGDRDSVPMIWKLENDDALVPIRWILADVCEIEVACQNRKPPFQCECGEFRIGLAAQSDFA